MSPCLVILLFRLTQLTDARLLEQLKPVASLVTKTGNEPHEVAVEVFGKLTSPPPPSHERMIAEEDPVDARHVAFLLFGFVIIISVVFAMTQTSAPHVSDYTLIGIELFVGIFVAVMMFQAVDDLADAIFNVNHHHHYIMVCIHALLWLPLATLAAFALQDRDESLAIISGVGGHFLSFFSAHAVLSVQERYFSDTILICAFGMVCTLFTVCVLFVLMYFLKRCLGAYPDGDTDEPPEWVEKVNDVENDFGAMALAVSMTMCVRFLILGRYPHFDGIKPGDTPLHSFWHRTLLLSYAVGLFTISALITPYIAILIDDPRPLVNRFGSVLRTFLAMSIAWAFLLWGHWEVYERQFHWSPMTARLVFGALCTVALVAAILGLALTWEGRRRYLAIYAVALLAGCSWEETFNHSLDLVLVGAPHKHFWKFAMAVGMISLIVPIWVIYLKPLVPKDMNAVERQVESLSPGCAIAKSMPILPMGRRRSVHGGIF